ncbi:uncharacterized protein LOC131299244 [Rhododendron vialii]|uniref:uncharacterized protein LOC131299244 n=1 Tax=Rhododendron vialii TaxID=182163 RepID=UPI00265E1855|nr:uncharacterized protein LOC131299244 [Rhododendron vialii]
MPKNEFKTSKSTRKPLRDVSNGARPSKSVKKKAPEDDDQAQDEALDRLLLVHSDLSSLIHQIDEHVVQALKVAPSKKGRKEIVSFTQVLSEIQSSLKPWAPILQKALSSHPGGSENLLGQPLDNRAVPILDEGKSDVVQSSEQTKLDSLVSPSPLVSWRADCTAEGGRQLFLLTPLPRPKAFSSNLQGSSQWVMKKITSTTAGVPSVSAISGDTTDNNVEGLAVKSSKVANAVENERESNLKPQFASLPKLSKMDCSALVMTPCLKMSPPKSCVLLEPISELSHKDTRGVQKSTPFPVTIKEFCRLQLSESSSSEGSEELALKYPELFGIQPPHKLGNGRTGVEASPDWFMSPPKTCVLMEPPEEKSFTNATSNCRLPRTACVQNQQAHSSFVRAKNDVQSYNYVNWNSHNEELGGGLTLIESTPMWKEPETALRTGKRPGENTLKKELWTRFEAATSHGTRVDDSPLQESAQKGFLDRLEEVSCDETSSKY